MDRYYADQHFHTSFSGDSDTPPEEQIKRALSLGMTEICVTDHHDYDMVSDVDFNLDFDAYYAKMCELKQKYGGIVDISIGVELGLQLHIAEYLDELVQKYGWLDFIIGSHHVIDGIDPYFPEFFEKHGADSYERYFKVTLERIKRIKCYDSLGHLDYIVRYGQKYGLSYSYRKYSDYIDGILRVLVSDGKALECNSGAFSRGMDEPNPNTDVLRRFKELGGELITLGSDAHTPETLGDRFDYCGELLKNCGFKYYAVYKKRKPEMCLL